MGKAFVAKLAKEGARDPEALAAWIGRKKHGKAFGKLAVAGRKAKSDKLARSKRDPMTRAERAQVNRMARDMWSEEVFNRADASTPQESDAKTREDVLKRRAIEQAKSRGVVRGDVSSVVAAEMGRRKPSSRFDAPVGQLVRPTTQDERTRNKADMRRIVDDFRASQEHERAALVAPPTATEQKNIDRAAAGLVSRPELFRQMDTQLPQEAEAVTRQQVTQRRAVDKARQLLASKRR
ncbi:hypothetical protein QMZ92_13180 [Streptomyces sp. HNM0645]|uniref:hypothetical protein n=1 Tax=Streptomyces sp. HNM0645 TaxID=2782343 RepID=UPI0024B67E6D|nr:hypothetical protein [Streptomyces sp. HNM0645]MDI9885320.1 hypothetical protein [Streptomyces sp. HNM0645]